VNTRSPDGAGKSLLNENPTVYRPDTERGTLLRNTWGVLAIDKPGHACYRPIRIVLRHLESHRGTGIYSGLTGGGGDAGVAGALDGVEGTAATATQVIAHGFASTARTGSASAAGRLLGKQGYSLVEIAKRLGDMCSSDAVLERTPIPASSIRTLFPEGFSEQWAVALMRRLRYR
jgi:hypothetical protein